MRRHSGGGERGGEVGGGDERLPASKITGFPKEETADWLGVQPMGIGDGRDVGMRGLC